MPMNKKRFIPHNLLSSIDLHRKNDRIFIKKQLYTFDSFVVGAGNRSAHAAALAVSGSLGAAYNPLFIYGERGLGKTHLLGAIGNHIQAQNKRAKIIVSSPSSFMNETNNGAHSAKLDKYYAMIRKADVLLIDDFQVMAGVISIRKEFLHTVELLHERRTLIVITSDRMPGDIPELDSRLLARIDDGIMEVIQPPYFMLRRYDENHYEWHRKN